MVLIVGICEAVIFRQSKREEKISSQGYWIHNKAEEMPWLPSGPFVKLGIGSILTVERTMSCISKSR